MIIAAEDRAEVVKTEAKADNPKKTTRKPTK